MVDTEKVANETKNYQPIPLIRSFLSEYGENNMEQEINENYKQIKQDVTIIIEKEMSRIQNDPDLAHLIRPD